MILVISCDFWLLSGAHLYPLYNHAKTERLGLKTGRLHWVPRARPNASADSCRLISFKVALDPFASQPFSKSITSYRAEDSHGLVLKLRKI